MSKWVIDKAFDGVYGHRVWNQSLNEKFSFTSHCKCRHLHGHNYLIKVYLESDTLQNHMVTDFNNLTWLKKFLDDYIDHKFVIDINDPLYDKIVGSRVFSPVFIDGVDKPVGHTIDLGVIEGVDREYLESFFVVDFAPTSENLSEWIFKFAKEKMLILADVVRVDWHETPKSRASYQE